MAASRTAATEGEVFHFVMIKPAHYDDDGYPVTWLRSQTPSNTLAAIYGLAVDCRERQVLGPGVEIRLYPLDETNSRIRPDRIIRMIRRSGGKALIGLVGVQSNQFPRAVDLAKPFREAGLPVAIGGFHVSGCLSMLPGITPEIQAAMDMGVTIFAGECEDGRLEGLLKEAWAGQMKPIYNYLDALPNLAGEPIPVLRQGDVERNSGSWSSFDLGRGCPFQCSFCTIINVQGRKSRFRTPDDLENIVRANAEQGVDNFLITDDNFARNKDWEAFFDRLIELAETKDLKVKLIIQVDTLCHQIPNFIEKAVRAGVRRVFIGLENINPDNLLAAKKRQNRITEYRHMIQAWHNRGVFTWAGYILGFPNDTKESILRDVEIIKRELPVDILEFFVLTPLPGSEDHKKMFERGDWMDPDLNRYNLHRIVSNHPRMSHSEWREAYYGAWKSYFTYEHIETVARRHAARPEGRPHKALQYMTEFKMLFEVEDIQPLEGGVFRCKHRLDRRPGRPIEHPLVFYPRYWAECAVKAVRYLTIHLKTQAILKRVVKDANRYAYSDLATQPVDLDEFETLDLFQETSGGVAAVDKKRRQELIFGQAGARENLSAVG